MLPKIICDYIKNELGVLENEQIQGEIALTDGKSGAEVYRAKIICDNRESGTYIIKYVDINNPWYSESEGEAARSEAFRRNAPEFQDRLVQLCSHAVVGQYQVMLYRQANDSVLHSASLEKLKPQEEKSYLELVAYELLEKMNVKVVQSQDLAGFFSNVLTYRLDIGGSFETKAVQVMERVSESAVIIQNKVFPNPFYYIRNQKQWLENLKSVTTTLLRGNMHGDLHGKNILCERNLTKPDEPNYAVIDYDSYREDGYLLFDHAYLELSIYLNSVTNNDMVQWRETIDPLLHGSMYSPVPEEVGETLSCFRNAICAGITSWASKRYPRLKDELEIQFCLARIAAGINYFAKKGIQEQGSLHRILLYLCISMEELFDKIKFTWNTGKTTGLAVDCQQSDTDALWNGCVKYTPNYIPILITDDSYSTQQYSSLDMLTRIPWSLVIEIGSKCAPHDISTLVPIKLAEVRNVILRDLNSNSDPIEYAPNSCAWLILKKDSLEMSSYGMLWIKYQARLRALLDRVLSVHGLNPYIFVFDCKTGASFSQRFYQLVLEHLDRVQGSRFIFLGKSTLTSDDVDTLQAYDCDCKEFQNTSLLDLAKTAGQFLPNPELSGVQEVVLPTLDTLPDWTLSDKELAKYGTCVELVYSGIETAAENVDFGQSFYRGNEIQWADIANRCDMPLFDNYDSKRRALLKRLEEGSPRVEIYKLVHGAGSGGTTLSKRLLWDMKDRVPTLRLLKYTRDTADILLEIYRKTGKQLLLSVEMGSTVINNDELSELMSKVNSENGKLLVLAVERGHGKESDGEYGGGKKPFISLPDVLRNPLAQNFYSCFSKMTKMSARLEALKNITQSSSAAWIAQRCPFFYGFYTFEDEYQLQNITHTVSDCSEEMKELLSDLSLVTIFSQNICISYTELPKRIPGMPVGRNPHLYYEKMDSSISKLVVLREAGWRLCHPLIAKTVLKEIYKTSEWTGAIFNASMNFITRLHKNYGDQDDAAAAILRELFVDRTRVDSEKTKFSYLIEQIREATKKEALFQTLIKLYPDNPHYHNHLARLLAYKEAPDYDNAIIQIDAAVDIAQRSGDTASVHYTTLGCIRSKKIFAYIKGERAIQQAGRYAHKLPGLLGEIKKEYTAAADAFLKAQEDMGKNDSYTYFPFIHMECRLIENIVGYDLDKRPLKKLLNEETDFNHWYQEHYGKAVQLLAEMQTSCSDYDTDFLDQAKRLVENISPYDELVVGQLAAWNNTEGGIAANARRACSAALFVRNGYSWSNMELKHLALVEAAMRSNLLQGFQGDRQRDINFWFEAVRRLKLFDPSEAIQFLEDYKADGYEKEYFLYLMYFLRLERGLSPASEVIRHIKRCTDMIPSGINTATPRDAYALPATCCPIISARSVSRGKSGIMQGLREFQGIITEVRSTSGTILVDAPRLEATFTPSIVDENGRKRDFSTLGRVKFNLVFSFSGLRAWNLDYIE